MSFLTDQVAHFQHRLEETRVWCISKNWTINPAVELRTVSLWPSELPLVGKFYILEKEQRQQFVEQLTAKRSSFLKSQDVTTFQSSTGGRLLAFFFEQSLCDGAAFIATQGFFDFDNVPPWDTWITFITNDPVRGVPWGYNYNTYILSWVPEPLVEIVQKGIDWNVEGCIQWATDIDTAFFEQLKYAGLLF